VFVQEGPVVGTAADPIGRFSWFLVAGRSNNSKICYYRATLLLGLWAWYMAVLQYLCL
jgi:hypothetical protein